MAGESWCTEFLLALCDHLYFHGAGLISIKLTIPVQLYWPQLFKSWIANYIHRINLYPVDNAIGFPNTYPLDSDLSGG